MSCCLLEAVIYLELSQMKVSEMEVSEMEVSKIKGSEMKPSEMKVRPDLVKQLHHLAEESARAVEETAAAIALEAPRAKEYSQAVVQAHFIKRFEADIRALRREDVVETRQRGCFEPVDEYVLRVAQDEAGEIME